MNVTLVIPRLGWGGASRSTLDVAFAQMASASAHYQFTLVVLEASAPPLEAEARVAGIHFVTAEQTEEMQRALRDADVVHVNYWNTPEMYAWLRAPQPPMRVVMTLHIAGDYASQILTKPVVAFPDWLVPTTSLSLEHPLIQARDRAHTTVILPGTHLPTTEIIPPPHAGLRIGYAGMVDFIKMHPHFIAMCGAVHTPRVIFPVAGGGDGFKTLKSQAQAAGIANRFEWLGYRSDILDVLATFDLFGYPLDLYTYATGDLILQQAMWLGVPPVLLDHGALPRLIQDNETGVLARDETGYIAALENLCENGTERRRLSQNARAYARDHFGAGRSAKELGAVYEALMQEPKRERVWTGRALDPRTPGAAALAESFGTENGAFQVSLSATDDAARAEYAIAQSPPRQTNAVGGGILDYRRAYPQDILLRLWAGLVMAQQGRYALAAAEFYAAKTLGLDNPRLAGYLERMMNHQPLYSQDAAND